MDRVMFDTEMLCGVRRPIKDVLFKLPPDGYSEHMGLFRGCKTATQVSYRAPKLS